MLHAFNVFFYNRDSDRTRQVQIFQKEDDESFIISEFSFESLYELVVFYSTKGVPGHGTTLTFPRYYEQQ